MDDSILQTNIIDDENKNSFPNHQNFPSKDDFIKSSQNFLANLMKNSFLLGADKLLMARTSPSPLFYSNFQALDNDHNEKSTSSTNRTSHETINDENTIYFPKEVKNYNSIINNDFPLNIISFFPLFLLKLAGLQIGLFLRLLTFPIWCFNFWLMFFMLPFQTFSRVKDHMKKKLLKACNAAYFRLLSFIFNRLKSPKTVVKLAIRFGRGFFCALYVFFVLFSLLVSGFVIGGFVMKNVVQEPIHLTETLTFDYTKTSPVAIVPIDSSLVSADLEQDKINSASVNLGRRAVPFNHKLQLTVSLTLPESDYNRKLGIFQVRVESLSGNGKVIVGSSYPTMLRFKSQPVRVIETLFKTVPLITGLQSEVQNLKVRVEEFTEGYEPTAFFKVVLEQRAEFKAGSGAPEIYAASIDIASELPQLRRLVWNWRRTIFVWISISSFMGEMLFALLFFRPIVLLGGRSKAAGINKKSTLNKISW